MMGIHMMHIPNPGGHPAGVVGAAPPTPALGVPVGCDQPMQAPQPQVLYQLPPGNFPPRAEPPPLHRPPGSFWQPSLTGCFHDTCANCRGRCSHFGPCACTWDDNHCDAGAVDSWEIMLSTIECLAIGLSCLWSPIKFGENYARVHPEGMGCCPAGTLYPFAFCCLGARLRSDIRTRFGLNEAPCSDMAVHTCCSCCGVHQEVLELRHHNL